MATLDDYIDERNKIQLRADARGKDAGDTCWAKLGVVNRHIDRLSYGELKLTPGVETEIKKCLSEVKLWNGCQSHRP